jgi:hypothetical protein
MALSTGFIFIGYGLWSEFDLAPEPETLAEMMKHIRLAPQTQADWVRRGFMGSSSLTGRLLLSLCNISGKFASDSEAVVAL